MGRAGNLIYKMASEELITELIELCKKVRIKGDKVGKQEWSIGGLLGDLGRSIESDRGIRYP